MKRKYIRPTMQVHYLSITPHLLAGSVESSMPFNPGYTIEDSNEIQ